MLSIALPSFLPISCQSRLSELFLHTSQLWSPHLAYKSIHYFLQPPDLQPVLQSLRIIFSNLPIASLNNFSELFVTSENIDKKEDPDKEQELIIKITANKVFFGRDITSNSDSDFESSKNSESYKHFNFI